MSTPQPAASKPAMFVKPKSADVKVRIPGTRKFLAAEGETVPRDSYWLRILADGDVVEADAFAPRPSGAARRSGGKSEE